MCLHSEVSGISGYPVAAGYPVFGQISGFYYLALSGIRLSGKFTIRYYLVSGYPANSLSGPTLVDAPLIFSMSHSYGIALNITYM